MIPTGRGGRPRRVLLVCLFFFLSFLAALGQEDGYYSEDSYYSEEEEGSLAGEVQSGESAAAVRALELQLEEEQAELELLREQQREEEEEAERLRQEQAALLLKTTYKKSVGGGLGRVAVLLVNERYIATTAAQYGCVLQKDLGVKVQAKNATKVMRTVQENEKRRQEEFGKVVLPEDRAGAAAVGPDGSAVPVDGEHSKAKSAAAAAQPEKKLTYREIQEQKQAERQAAEREREALKGKFELGVSCETLVCGSCKAMVDEFAGAIVQGMTDPRYVYIEDILPEFCQRKEIVLKYTDIVASICFSIYSDKGGYREAFLMPFENDSDWPNVMQNPGLFRKKQQACTAIGACAPSHFELVLAPKKKQQEHWDHKCYVCQAFALDLEERIQLSKGITDGSITQVVADTCNRLGLAPAMHALCAPLAEGTLLDDVAWIAKMHSEALARKAKGEVGFADKLCEEVRFCERYVDPLDLQREQEAKMEQVFF